MEHKQTETAETKPRRHYFVAALLIIITLMMVVIVIILSNYLVQKQRDALEDGQWLAEKYEDAITFAENLQAGAELMLSGAGRETEGKMLLALAMAHSRNFSDLLAEAESRRDKVRVSEARKRYTAEMEKLHEALGTTGEPAGWFASPDAALWEAVRDAGAQMSGALLKYRLPVVDAGFRMMAAGEGWLEPAREAAEAWANLVNKLP